MSSEIHRYHQHHHHHHSFKYQKNLQIHNQRSTFLPMLCSKPSIKDVSLPKCLKDRPSSPSCDEDDPLSPRIGCMGQVKRNNKISGFPTSTQHRLSFNSKSSTTTSNSSNSSSPVVKYSKLKNLFTARNFSTPKTATFSTNTISSCGTRQRVAVKSEDVAKKHRCTKSEIESLGSSNIISIEDMDPPLPVIKRVQQKKVEEVDNSLWKRRSGGNAIKSLQVQQIQHPRICIQPTSV